MKLVEILARELKEWPAGIVTAVQDVDGEVKFDDSSDYPAMADSCNVWIRNGCGDNWRHASSIASDYATAIVTRAQWQEAREALNKPAAFPSLAAKMCGIDSRLEGKPLGATHYIMGEFVVDSWWMREPGDQWFIWSEPARQWALDTPSAGQKNLMKPVKAKEVEPWSGEGLPPVGTQCEMNGTVGQELRGQDFSWVSVEVIAHTDFGGEPIAVGRDLEMCTLGWGIASRFRPIRTPEQIAAEGREKAILEMARSMMVGLVVAGDPDFKRAEKLYDAGYRKVKDGNQGGEK